MRLLTDHPELSKYHERWHRCEAVRLTRDDASGYYVLHVTSDLAAAVGRGAQGLFDEMDRAA